VERDRKRKKGVLPAEAETRKGRTTTARRIPIHIAKELKKIMKLLKKTAALLFCLALALSVMAVTALADDDDVELLSANTTYTLTFKSDATHTSIDNDQTPDYKTSDNGIVSIYLTGSDAVSVNGVQFALSVGTGVTVGDVTIGGKTITANNGVYQYLKEYNGGNILSIPDGEITDTTTPIGTITFTTAASVASKTDVTFTASDVAVHETTITDKKDVASITPATISVHPNYTITLLTYGADNNGIKNTATTPVMTTGETPVALTYTYNVVDNLSGTMTLPAQSLDYYVFGGWQISGNNNWDGGTISASDTNLVTASNNAYATGKYGNVTLTAIFTPEEYAVTFAAGYDNGTVTNTAGNYTIESQVAVTGDNPTRDDGYSFDGWVATGGNWSGTYGSGCYTSTNDQAFPANGMHGALTLTAQWTPTTYSLTFKPGYTGEGAPANETTTYNAGAAIEKANPERAGYNFKGWTANISTGGWSTSTVYGTTYNSSGLATDGEITLVAFTAGLFGNVELTATWEANQYAMTFVPGHADVTLTDAGDAGESGNYSVNFKTDDVVSINGVTATRAGYTFKGWKVTVAPTSGLSANDVVADDFTAGFYGNVTVTPTWEINGAFKQIAYAFSDKQLTLVAISTTSDNTATAAGNYTFGEATMYPVANRYATLCDGIESADGYVVYATLADPLAAGTDWKDSVTFTKGEAVDGPSYDGNVNNSAGVDVGDYGTAGTIFEMQIAYSGTITVLNRLGMDMDAGEFSSEDAITMIGHINDLKAIMDAAAPAASSTP
jgi:uncharacterized repeat protein (TIGR02543 family)